VQEYLTTNSCYPSDIGSCRDCGTSYPARRNPVTGQGNMGDCCLGTQCSAANVPEVFLNCADIAITGGESSRPPTVA
jgi:hypothetical protein